MRWLWHWTCVRVLHQRTFRDAANHYQAKEVHCGEPVGMGAIQSVWFANWKNIFSPSSTRKWIPVFNAAYSAHVLPVATSFFCIGWDIWNFSLLILFARSVLGLCRVKNILQSHMCCLCSCEWVQDGPRVPEINKWRLYIHAVALLSWLVPVIQVLLTATHFCADTVRLQFHPQRQERSKLRQHALLLLSEHACLAYGASIVSKPNQKFHA